MSELEDTSGADGDRAIDQQSFNCSQFEIFTHEYRERTEVPECDDHDSNGSCCSSPSSSGNAKKRIINTMRKLQKALVTLEVIADMLQKMRETMENLTEQSKQVRAEFSTTTVPIPPFDSTDMKLLLGENEVPPMQTPFEELEEMEKSAQDRLKVLLFEAETLLQEYDHIKHGIRG
ncbi:unnamed protein product [Nippostrongylus brasiliensis]|uniref:Protein MIS12 homolog n=1 Tax=Nippostrongylus brasiliensis TaxID=27835 RepID=A0A0N4XCU9_NIPBR|nr:unnamed protein product [Nippostrongylus brasiliensis]